VGKGEKILGILLPIVFRGEEGYRFCEKHRAKERQGRKKEYS